MEELYIILEALEFYTCNGTLSELDYLNCIKFLEDSIEDADKKEIIREELGRVCGNTEKCPECFSDVHIQNSYTDNENPYEIEEESYMVCDKCGKKYPIHYFYGTRV